MPGPFQYDPTRGTAGNQGNGQGQLGQTTLGPSGAAYNTARPENQMQTGNASTFGGAQSLDNHDYGNVVQGSAQAAERWQQFGQQAGARNAPHVTNPYASADRLGMGQAGFDQSKALGLQAAAARGDAPSVAAIQQQQGLNDSIAAQMAMANSARGGAGAQALAQRQAAMQGSQMQLQGVNQAAALRAQEMAQARGDYMQGATQARAQELSQYGLDQDSAFKQAQLEMQSRALNDQTQLGYEGMGQKAYADELGARVSMYGADQGVGIANSQQQAATTSSAIGAGGAILGGMAMMSDARAKTDVRDEGVAVGKPGGGNTGAAPHVRVLRPESMMSDERAKEGTRHGGEVEGFLGSLHPASYRYKDGANAPNPEAPGGRYLGVMAQDVERGPTGDTLVHDTPRGKMLDIPASVSATLAALGNLDERMAKIERQRRKAR